MSAASDEQTHLSGLEGEGRLESEAAPPVPHMSAWQTAVKRLADFLFSLTAVIVLAPLGLIVAAAIKLDSKGPVFFKQLRVGRNGSLFTIYKFRSMHENADQMKQELEELNEAEGPVFKIKRDPRITRVGAFIRRTSLDELPQFLNVLKGDMSLVGPRPALPKEVDKYTDYQRGRLVVVPGLTCLWQIQGRSSLSFERWVELDLEYISRQSLWLDLVIILKTIPAVLKGTGAY